MRQFLFCILVLAGLSVNAQPKEKNFKVQIGMNFGVSQLQHNTRFETTTLYNLYKTIAKTHTTDPYTWEEFEEDFGLRQSVFQPRFGLSAMMTYKDWPVFVLGEAMSSTSSYQDMAYSATCGIGKDFYAADEAMYFSFHAGYKFVKDNGFGAKTIVNSIGDKELRDLVSTYFGPDKPIGDDTGQLLMIRGGLGKDFGQGDNLRIGAEVYGELDLTDKLKRESRMTNIGAQIYLRFKI